MATYDSVFGNFAEAINSAGALSNIEIARMRPIDVSRTLDALPRFTSFCVPVSTVHWSA